MRKLILIAFIFASCNPVKKVLRSDKMMQDVVIEWNKKNPPKTETIILPGKDTTIIRDSIVLDSVPLPYPVTTTHRVIEKHYIDRLIVDTLRIIDRSLDSILVRRLQAIEGEMQIMSVKLSAQKKESWIWRIVAIAAVVFIVGRPILKLLK